MTRIFLSAALTIISALGQTQVDFRTQAKPASKPVKSGTALPASCVVGDIFVNTIAPLGQNLYACIATNVWSFQVGTGGGTLALESDGIAVGSENTLNLASGTGILNAVADTGGRFNVTNMIDTAVVETHTTLQSGQDVLCASASNSPVTYTCQMAPTLSTYTMGMVLNWIPDVASNGTAITLSIDGLNAIPIKMSDGTTDPTSADVIAGRLTPIWYDGSIFRLQPARGATATVAAAIPQCTAALRGRLWSVPGAAGAKDQVSICVKDATDRYLWWVVY